MTAVTPTVYNAVPGSEAKVLVISLPSTTAASDTVALAGYIGTIYGAKLGIANGAACAASTTWSSTTVTIPSTEATGAKTLLVWGIS